MKGIKRLLTFVLVFGLLFLVGCKIPNTPDKPNDQDNIVTPEKPFEPEDPNKFQIKGDIEFNNEEAHNKNLNVSVNINGIYNQEQEVSLYLIAFKKLPSNYYARAEFNKIKGTWTKDNLISCFGGKFSNREQLLPRDDSYFECDINYKGGGRNAQRIVYNDSYSKIYYTTDHYGSFVKLYDNYIYDGATQYVFS